MPYDLTFLHSSLVSTIPSWHQCDGLVGTREQFFNAETFPLVGIFQGKLQVAIITVAITEGRFVRVGLFIGGYDPFIISQDHFIGRPRDEIVRHDGDFPASARRVDHVGRHTKNRWYDQ